MFKMEDLKIFGDLVRPASGPSSQKGSQNSTSSLVSAISGGTLNESLFLQAAISQRIVTLEYYMSPPVKEFDNLYSDFKSSEVKKVPIVRIFGTTSAGQKICANIHGVYPYVSVVDDETVPGFEYKLANALDSAINNSVHTDKFRNGAQSHKTEHVFKVIRVVGKTFYGYRSSNEVFLRIFFYSPMILKKAVDLLQDGSVLGRRFQPYEAHIPFSMQFMIDYSLYGMNYVHYSAVKFRRNFKESTSGQPVVDDMKPLSQNSNNSLSSLIGYVDPDNIQESQLGPPQLNKLTLCELEIDVLASDIILATKASGKTMSVNPGIDCIWKDEIERRRLHGLENCSQVTIPESQDRPANLPMHSAELKYVQTLWDKFDTLNFSDNDDGKKESTPSQFRNSSNMEEDEVMEIPTSQLTVIPPSQLTVIPSSQIMNHLSVVVSRKDHEDSDNELSQEQDEFLKLLEEMAADDPSSELDERAHEVVEDPFGKQLDENQIMGEFPEDDDGIDEDENLWEESLLNASIVETILDSESNCGQSEPEQAQQPAKSVASSQSKPIFQCDGQGNDSDSSSDDTKSAKVRRSTRESTPGSTRKSGRMSELKATETPANSKSTIDRSSVRKSSRHSKTLHDSPGSRLSLTLRRKSRSQDALKHKSQDTPVSSKVTPGSSNSKLKPGKLRRSISMDESVQSEIKKGVQPNLKKRENDESLQKPVSKKEVRKSSSSTNSTLQNDEKAGCSSSKMKTDPKKYKNEVVSSSNEAAKAKFLQKVPLVCLTKLGQEQISSKRIRRKPRRFVVEAEDETSRTPEDNREKCEEPEKTKLVDGDLLETLPKIKKRREKQRKASVEEVEVDRTEASDLAVKNEVKEEKQTEKIKRKPGRPSLANKPKSVESDFKLICERNGESEIQIFSQNTKKEMEQQRQTEKQNSVLLGKEKKILKKLKLTEAGPDKDRIKQEASKSSKVDTPAKADDDNFVDSLISTKPKITAVKSTPTTAQAMPDPEDNVKAGVQSLTDSVLSSLKDHSIVKKKKKKLGLGLSRVKKVAPSTSTDASTTLVSAVEKPCITNSGKDGEEVVSIFESSDVEEAKTEVKKIDLDPTRFSDVGITCQPPVNACEVQTDPAPTQDASVSAFPEMLDGESQASQPATASHGSQAVKEMVSIEIQTDAIAPLCLCQCTCVIKEKTDVGTDNQDELKPVMESKRIQVDNVDMVARARSTWFTTPQSNKTKRTTTPSSPEKRRFTESPSRRGMQNTTPNPSHSRYLNALVLKTPTSTHKYRNFVSRASPSTPTESYTFQEQSGKVSTPPSREEYLINAIRAASSSPRKRAGHIKPRNLEIETHTGSFSNAEAVSSSTNENDTCVQSVSSPLPLVPVGSIEDEMHGAMESPISTSSNYEDLSVNSIYEYEEEAEPPQSPAVAISPSWPLAEKETFEESEDESSPLSISSFQRKRIMSKHRTKNRLEKRRAANLDANRGIPDIFEFEFEPLKQPPTYRSTTKWLESGKVAVFDVKAKNGSPEKFVVETNGDSSDEEELPPPVKLFGGGNMSDDDNSDSEDTRRCSGTSVDDENVSVIKPFTPPVVFNCTTPINDNASQNSESCNSATTPRSILRQSGMSRRQNARVSKRKIRWEDESESCSKRLKMEDDDDFYMKRESLDDDSQNTLSNGSLNKTADTSELDGPSFKNALGLENSMSNFQDVKALHQCQFITTMCVEVHCASRNGLLPDPAIDSIYAIFVLISNDYPEGFGKPKEYLQLLILDETSKETTTNYSYDSSRSTTGYSSEGEMIDAFVTLVRSCDPDIFVGYEIEKSSFGYLIQRALRFGKNLTQELSRVLPIIRKDGTKEVPYRSGEEWNGTISGRIVLNLWRLLRHEITVQSYTFENAAYHILLRRVCKFSYKTLSMFWSHKMHRHKVIQYYTVRVKGCIQIMEKLDLINRTSELARLFGIQFYEVLSRGSQFRVESMMLRATKPLDYIAPSPTVQQRAKMRAPEYLPLIMEPRSNYYTDPVAVLDFQSLYPSMMIAYNYDYASLLGRVEHLTTLNRFPMGCLDHAVPATDLLKLKNNIHISPAGIAFVDKSVVRGVVPEMLEQILDTRQMVKRAMKKWKNDGASLRKVLDSRQLGLKLIANVTYGYTSANFSGRMPCVEIADSIVSKGRETLQRAIDHVKENYHRWGGEVVYGDTDSMFILFRGKSKDEAFKLAYEIADEVTQANPKPVKLKFEKIYQPCILQSKKRYVGYAYETPDQVKPIYDAKGIETVRRDGCPAVRKILEKTLHVLFTSNKPKKVEEYVKAQFQKLFKGRVSMQDYIFAREFRGRAGYKPTASVPSLEIAKRLTEHDPRAEPLVSERVPYVVIYGNPTLPLIKLVRTPNEYLENPGTRLNAHYYIEKVIIPALNRCLSHAGINAMKWYLQLPRKYLRNILDQKPKGQGTLDDYILHQNCLRCDGKAEDGLCKTCLSDETSSVIYLQEVVRNAKSKLNACVEICANCAGETGSCISIDCPVLHKLTRYQRDQPFIKNVEKQLMKLDW